MAKRTGSTNKSTTPRTQKGDSQAKSRTRSTKKTKKKAFSATLSSLLGKISSERKMDIAGIILALIGLITVFSLFSPKTNPILGWWVTNLYYVAGWGIFLLPLTLIIVGLWLVFRNLEKSPRVSVERLSGIILLYLNILAWIHLIGGGGWDLAKQGKGGGYLGGFFSNMLVSGFGVPATFVIFAAWLLFAISLSFDQSSIDLILKFKPIKDELMKSIRKWRRKRRVVITPTGKAILEEEITEELPPDFTPLEALKKMRSTRSKKNGEQPEEETDIQLDEAGFPLNPPTTSQNWIIPSVEAILDPPTALHIRSNIDEERSKLIEDTLMAFGAPGHVVEVHSGPTITQYGVEPDFIKTRSGRTRVRVSKIVSLADDLALALAAPRIRIQAPVPGRNYIGIEVPNSESRPVTLRELLESEQFKQKQSPLRMALGKDVAGTPIVADLKEMPHLLIAGTTGSGKSVCVNTILCTFLLHNSPTDLRLVLVDPKRVELTGYNGIPHLLSPVIVDAERVISALQWVSREMDKRYKKFTKNGVRNIYDYNISSPEDYLPHLVVVIDELADLMMLAPDETERTIARLAQLARATGIHLIIATQRPSVDVVTGLIKANFPARVAFAVASSIDSRVILDQTGADRLLGRGDMLFLPPEASAPIRLQGAYVSDSEIQLLVDYWQYNALSPDNQSQGSTDEGIDALPNGVPLHQIPLWEEIEEEKNSDPVLADAIEIARSEGRASITMLQRKLRIGYTRSARLIDKMEEMGIIGPATTHSQVREILDYGTKEESEDPEEPFEEIDTSTQDE